MGMLAVQRCVVRVVALAAVVVLPLGCGSGYHGECSLIGGHDAVEVDFDHVRIPASAELRLRACVLGRCSTQPFHGLDPASVARDGLFVLVPHLPVDADVKISIRLFADSRLLFDGSTVAHTRKVQPNGPNCEPTVWHAYVVAHGRTKLTAE